MTTQTSSTNLIVGQSYDLCTLRLVGWTEGDGSGHDGYNIGDFFGHDGVYLGADSHGISPIVAEAARD